MNDVDVKKAIHLLHDKNLVFGDLRTNITVELIVAGTSNQPLSTFDDRQLNAWTSGYWINFTIYTGCNYFERRGAGYSSSRVNDLLTED